MFCFATAGDNDNSEQRAFLELVEVGENAADDDDRRLDDEPNGLAVAVAKFLLATVVVVVAANVVRRTATFRNAIIFIVISTLGSYKDFQISAPVVFLLDDLDNLEMQLDSD